MSNQQSTNLLDNGVNQPEINQANYPSPVERKQLGPNGCKIGYTENGDMVEWLPGDDEDCPDEEFPVVILRNMDDIAEEYKQLWDKVWWYRHKCWVQRIDMGEEELREEQKSVFEYAKKAARRIERKYGKEALKCDEFERALMMGRMSALAWVLGAEWEDSLST